MHTATGARTTKQVQARWWLISRERPLLTPFHLSRSPQTPKLTPLGCLYPKPQSLTPFGCFVRRPATSGPPLVPAAVEACAGADGRSGVPAGLIYGGRLT